MAVPAPPAPPPDSQMSDDMATLFARGAEDKARRRPGELKPEAVLGKDERVRRTDTTSPPLDCLCALEVHGIDGARQIGTGWLVGPRTVVTAAHVVSWQGFRAQRLRVVPGRNDNTEPLGLREVPASAVTMYPGWTGDNSRDTAAFDVATIRLPADFVRPRWLGVAAPDDPVLAHHWLNIAGYPREVGPPMLPDQVVNPGGELWWHAARVQRTEPHWLFYDNDTSGGQSGAPALMVTAGAPWGAPPVAVGVHVRAPGIDFDPKYNAGVRLTPALLGWLGDRTRADNASA